MKTLGKNVVERALERALVGRTIFDSDFGIVIVGKGLALMNNDVYGRVLHPNILTNLIKSGVHVDDVDATCAADGSVRVSYSARLTPDVLRAMPNMYDPPSDQAPIKKRKSKGRKQLRARKVARKPRKGKK